MISIQDSLNELYEDIEITRKALNDIKKNRTSSFRKGTFHAETLKIRDLRQEIQIISNKIAILEMSL